MLADLFQSTHPTRECDAGHHVTYDDFSDISIHAPYKRVRLDLREELRERYWISIHAPYKRVRRMVEHETAVLRYFNPRTLQESATQQRAEVA